MRVPEFDYFPWTPVRTLAGMAAADIPWEYYLNTKVAFDTGTVEPIEAVHSGSRPPLGSLHVVTAIQPTAKPEPAAVSQARMEVLDRHLDAVGLRWIPVVGSSLDGDHSEDSRAVFGLTDTGARSLGLRFGQVAVFAWNGPHWSLLACATDRRSDRGWQWNPSPRGE